MRRCKLVMLSAVLFIILTGLAMFFYPGGAKFDRGSLNFSFVNNFFSDLGATTTYSGKQNTVSNILFITALGGMGIVLIYFSKIWRAVSTDSHEFKFAGFLSKFFLIACGISFVGIAFTPWDKFFAYHLFFVKCAFLCLLFWTIIMSGLELRNPKLKYLVFLNLIYLFCLSYYVYKMFSSPDPGNEADLEFQSISGKIIIYLSIINLFIQASGLKHFLRSADFRRNGMKNFYV